MPLDFFIGDRDGFTPQIARLVGMMDYARHTTLEAVQGMSVAELDLIPAGLGNSAGMLLEHMCAIERIYQLISLDYPNPDEALGERWMTGLELGALGRERIRGHALSYYLHNLAEARAETLDLFRSKDDAWLEEELPFWGDTGNRYFMWFHVFEDEINHRGQIRLIHKHLPRLMHRGMTGARFAAASAEGLGAKCAHIWSGSPAEKAGMQAGDVVLEYDGQDVTGTPFHEIAFVQPAGTRSKFKLRRGAEVLELDVLRIPTQ